MTRKSVTECDGCHQQVATTDDLSEGWLEINDPNRRPRAADPAVTLTFCGYKCLSDWAADQHDILNQKV